MNWLAVAVPPTAINKLGSLGHAITLAVAVIVENGGTGSGKAATVASKVVRQWVLGD